MPSGIAVAVETGFATVEFLDQSLAGPALAAVIKQAGPGMIDVDTSGERRSYIIPESVAAAAGLIDTETAKKPAARKKAGRRR